MIRELWMDGWIEGDSKGFFVLGRENYSCGERMRMRGKEGGREKKTAQFSITRKKKELIWGIPRKWVNCT